MRSSFKIATDLIYLNKNWILWLYRPFVIIAIVAFAWEYLVGNYGCFKAAEISFLPLASFDIAGTIFLMIYVAFTFEGNLNFLRGFNLTRKKYFTSNTLSLFMITIIVSFTQKMLQLIYSSIFSIDSLYELIYGNSYFIESLIWLLSLNIFMVSGFYLFLAFTIWQVNHDFSAYILVFAVPVVMITAVIRVDSNQLIEQLVVTMKTLSQSLLLEMPAAMILLFTLLSAICLLTSRQMLKKTSTE